MSKSTTTLKDLRSLRCNKEKLRNFDIESEKSDFIHTTILVNSLYKQNSLSKGQLIIQNRMSSILRCQDRLLKKINIFNAKKIKKRIKPLKDEMNRLEQSSYEICRKQSREEQEYLKLTKNINKKKL